MPRDNDAYSINETTVSKAALEKLYKSLVSIRHNNNVCRPNDLDYIFDVAIDNKSFPNIIS